MVKYYHAKVKLIVFKYMLFTKWHIPVVWIIREMQKVIYICIYIYIYIPGIYYPADEYVYVYVYVYIYMYIPADK